MSRLLILIVLTFLLTPFIRAERVFDMKGNVMVPVRYIADWLGATMTTDAKTKATTFAWNGKTAIIKLNNVTATVAGKPVKLPVAPIEGKGILYAPVQLFKALGIGLPEDFYGFGTYTLTNPKNGKQLELPIMDNDESTTPLHLDALNGLIALAELHLKRGISVNVMDSRKVTPLYVAAEQGKMEMVKFLIDKGAKINDASEYSGTALSAALQSKHVDVARFLLDKGATGNTETMALAAGCGAKEIVQYLLDKGVPVNPEDKDFFTSPLISAAENGNTEIVSLLLDKGAEVDAVNFSGESPLFVAAKEDRGKVVALLLEKGAKPNKRASDWQCSYGRSYGMLSINYNLTGMAPLHIASMQGSINAVEALLKGGADVEFVSGDELTPLHCAALSTEKDAGEVIDALLEKKANANAVAKDLSIQMTAENIKELTLKELTPLQLAVLSSQDVKSKVKALIAAGADVNAKAKNGMTALHFATLIGDDSERICSLLIDAKADVTAKSTDGLTPLALAKKVKAEDTIKLLQDSGAKE